MMCKEPYNKQSFDGVIFVPRPPRQSNHTRLVPYCALRFNVPRLLMPVYQLDVFVKYHFPYWRTKNLRRKVLLMKRQDKMNFLRTHIANLTLAWDKADDVRTDHVYRVRNRLHSHNYVQKKQIVNARGDAF